MPSTIEPSTTSNPSTDSSTLPTMFHISLNVANLEKAIAFYRVLLGVAPAKCYPDYAKFEMVDPPLVLSLEPQAHATGGALNHLGFRVPTAAALVEIQHRLESAGIATNREEGVECCYARQTKFWVKDTDRNLWELYVLEADTDHRGAGSSTLREEHAAKEAEAEDTATAPPADIEGSRMGASARPAVPGFNSACGRNRRSRSASSGTFNVPLSAAEQKRIVARGAPGASPGRQADRSRPWRGRIARSPATRRPSRPRRRREICADAKASCRSFCGSAGFSALRLAKLSATPVLPSSKHRPARNSSGSREARFDAV